MDTIVKCLTVFLCFILLELQFAAFGTNRCLSRVCVQPPASS